MKNKALTHYLSLSDSQKLAHMMRETSCQKCRGGRCKCGTGDNLKWQSRFHNEGRPALIAYGETL